MSAAALRPAAGGEPLMDAKTFYDLYSRVASFPVERTGEPEIEPPPLELPDRAPPRRWVRATQTRRGPASPPASPSATAALEDEIGRCSDATCVARLGVYLARAYSASAALLLVRSGLIETLCCDGLDVRASGLLLPADWPSFLAEVVATGEPFRGAPREGELDQRILRALGREQVQEIAVLPVAVGGRVVSLLYADNGPEALGDASVAALAAVGERVASAYTRLILERKQGRAARG